MNSVLGTSRTPDEIQHDIELTRSKVDQTLDELQERLSIRNRVHHAVDRARDNGRYWADAARQLIREHPTAAMVGAVSLALLCLARARHSAARRRRFGR